MDDGALLRVYDPKVERTNAISQFTYKYSDSPHDFDSQFLFFDSPQEAAEDAHAIVVLTEWESFKSIDYESLFRRMEQPAFVFDGRNILPHDKLVKIGFEVHAVGKRPMFAAATPSHDVS
eukprot:GHVU01066419.1.p2 GENE.GHVU01066419.1~~GHVU01066419.1.p2  ORF type:complete len:120 (-),score=21.47 GHVU01066419.1:361-720(-)